MFNPKTLLDCPLVICYNEIMTKMREEHDSLVRKLADSYTVTLYMGVRGWFKQTGVASLHSATLIAKRAVKNKKINPGGRSATISAVASEFKNHFVLVGIVDPRGRFIPVV